MEISCNTIVVTYRRNSSLEYLKNAADLQIVALAKSIVKRRIFLMTFEMNLEPCKDNELLFECLKDYSKSCLNRELQCNGRSECPSGDDERNCHRKSSMNNLPTNIL